MSGKLMCLTGLDGCGKSTQITLICNWLSSIGISYSHIRLQDMEIPQIEVMKDVMKYIKQNNINLKYINTESLIIGFKTKLIIEKHIRPLIEKNELVLAERYIESNELYLKRKNINSCHYENITKNNILPAHLTIFLNVPVKECYDRICIRGTPLDHESIENLQFAEHFFRNNSNYNFLNIDGTKKVNEIFIIIKKIMEKSIL